MENNTNWHVQFSGKASELLVNILEYLLEREDADYALDLVKTIRKEGKAKLSTLPYRGKVVPELSEVTKNYREIRVKSYRLIYRPIPDQQTVLILLVAHGKQDISEVLYSLMF